MTPHFFLLGMDLLSHKCAKIYSSDQVYIALKYPRDKTYNFTFSKTAFHVWWLDPGPSGCPGL
jgi:hypothetical protein